MVLEPQKPYSFHVRPLDWIWSGNPDLAKDLIGAFKVELRRVVPVVFVPAFDHEVIKLLDSNPPVWCRNPGPERRVDTALLWASLRAEYVVTPDDNLANTERRFVLEKRDAPLELFFVGRQEFFEMQNEMSRLVEKRPGVRSYWRHDEVEGLRFAELIRQRVAVKEKLHWEHWDALER